MKKAVNYKLRLSEELQEKIRAAAELRRESLAEYYRRVLDKSVSEDMAEESLDVLLPAVRKAVKDVSKPAEERLAKLNAKTAIQAGTIYYLLLEIIDATGGNARESKVIARKKAVADLKADLMSEDD